MIFKPWGFREWLARRLLNAAFSLAKNDWPTMQDGIRGWQFNLRWKQRTIGLAEKLAPFLDK